MNPVLLSRTAEESRWLTAEFKLPGRRHLPKQRYIVRYAALLSQFGTMEHCLRTHNFQSSDPKLCHFI